MTLKSKYLSSNLPSNLLLNLIFFILILINIFINTYNITANDDPKWTKAEDLSQIGNDVSADGCIYPKTNAGFSSVNLNIEPKNRGKWINSGALVSKNKLLDIKWHKSARFNYGDFDKYKILYRLDPRFSTPQIFIQKYDHEKKIYISDFHQFRNGILAKYQNDVNHGNVNMRIKDYYDYFSFRNRDNIKVKKNDSINIKLISSDDFFNNSDNFSKDMIAYNIKDANNELLLIDTRSDLPDNQILSVNSNFWCEHFNITSMAFCYKGYYSNNYFYTDTYLNHKSLMGISLMPLPVISRCENNKTDLNKICYNDIGKFITIKAGNQIINDGDDIFSLGKENNYFTYGVFNGNQEADLTFNNDLRTGVLDAQTYMSNWQMPSVNQFESWYKEQFDKAASTSNPEYIFYFNQLNFGRYFFEIEIGRNSGKTPDNHDDIQCEYLIIEDGEAAPNDSVKGNKIDNDFSFDANKDGVVWIKATSNVNSDVSVKIQYFNSRVKVSDVLYNGIINPIKSFFNNMAFIVYNQIINNNLFKNLIFILLTFYVGLFGASYLGGFTQISLKSIINMILKITIIFALLSPWSWSFFSGYLLDAFLNLVDFLINSVTGATSSKSNVFGFIDPIIAKYLNGEFWGLLLIELFYLKNGIFLFSIITIYSIILYFSALLEIIITYLLAFIGMIILISLAPFFIILILFNRSKSIFDNWISTLFRYSLQPTILLLLFLFVDQLMSEHINNFIVPFCWRPIIDLSIYLNLGHLFVPLVFDISLPFLNAIYFYVPQIEDIQNSTDLINKNGTIIRIISSSIMIYVFARITKGTVGFVETLVTMLTGMYAPNKKIRSLGAPAKDVMHQMAQTWPVKSVTNFAKGTRDITNDKLVKQKISDRNLAANKEKSKEKIDYNIMHKKSNNKSTNSNLDDSDNDIKNKKDNDTSTTRTETKDL